MSAEAIVLGSRAVGEADLLVTFLTEAEGKLTGSARNARKSLRRFGGGFAPMARGRAIWQEAQGRDLVRLESFEATHRFTAQQRELRWFYLFAYLAEVSDTFARDREPDPRFFRLVRAAADASERDVPPDTVRRWFELWTLRLQGLLPDFDTCSACGSAFAAGRGVVVGGEGEGLCEACARRAPEGSGKVRLSPAEAAWIREALHRGADAIPPPPPGGGIGRLTKLLLQAFTGRAFRTARFLEGRTE